MYSVAYYNHPVTIIRGIKASIRDVVNTSSKIPPVSLTRSTERYSCYHIWRIQSIQPFRGSRAPISRHRGEVFSTACQNFVGFEATHATRIEAGWCYDKAQDALEAILNLEVDRDE